MVCIECAPDEDRPLRSVKKKLQESHVRVSWHPQRQSDARCFRGRKRSRPCLSRLRGFKAPTTSAAGWLSYSFPLVYLCWGYADTFLRVHVVRVNH